MTQEHPEVDTRTVRCDNCGSYVELIRRNRTLAMTCDCPEMRSLKVATTLPDGW